MAAIVQSTVKYRKVPPSRIARDIARASKSPSVQNVLTKQIGNEDEDDPHDKISDSPSELNLPDGFEAVPVPCDQGYSMTPLHNMNMDTQFSPVVQVDGPADLVDCTTYSLDNMEAKCGSKICKQTDSPVGSGLNADNDISYTCKSCQIDLTKVPNKSWHRCTDPVCHEYNICDTCHASGYHAEHLRHSMPFRLPDSENNHCDSCGYDLPGEGNVYVCSLCDHYTMCHNCYYWCGMHVAHKQYIKKVLVKDYLST